MDSSEDNRRDLEKLKRFEISLGFDPVKGRTPEGTHWLQSLVQGLKPAGNSGNAIGEYSQQELQTMDNAKFTALYTGRRIEEKKGEWHCYVSDWTELHATVKNSSQCNQAIDDELIRLRNMRIKNGMDIPQPPSPPTQGRSSGR